MSRVFARIVRIAGVAALMGVVATGGLVVSKGSMADEMIDPPKRSAKAGKRGKAASTKAGRESAKRGKDKSSTPRPERAIAQTPAPVPVPPSDSSAPAAPNTAEKPLVSDPRIDKLMEGARKAWESVGQPSTGDATAPTGPATASTATAADAADLVELKATFRRPPEARAAPRMDGVAALGARLFVETKLSADHKMSCATCHDPAKSFSDGRARSVGRLPEATRRNTPSLWNTGFARAFGWNGGVATLPAQIKAEVEREGGMDGTLEAAAVWLARDQTYVQAFDSAFARANALSTETVTAALAAYVKTLVSPPTRFDRFVDGDAQALTATEVEGFRLFAGKAGCAACHNGWRFTDDASRSSAGRSVKTPGLREAAWGAPYMLDGRAKTLEAAVAHAAATRGAGSLSVAERRALVAFVKTLSSEQPPVPVAPVR